MTAAHTVRRRNSRLLVAGGLAVITVLLVLVALDAGRSVSPSGTSPTAKNVVDASPAPVQPVVEATSVTVAAPALDAPTSSGSGASDRLADKLAESGNSASAIVIADEQPEWDDGEVQFGSLSVRVKSVVGGPCLGVGVWLTSTATDHEVRISSTKRTDENGVALFERVRSGPAQIETLFGTPSRRVQVMPGSHATIEVVADATCLIVGSVRDAFGRPVEGAEIWEPQGGVNGRLVQNPTAQSDSEGRFRLTARAGGTIALAAVLPPYLPSEIVIVDRSQAVTSECDLVLDRVGAELALHVVDAAGSPLTGAEVRLGLSYCGPRNLKSWRRGPTARLWSARTNSAGLVRLAGLPSGFLQGEVSISGACASEILVLVRTGATDEPVPSIDACRPSAGPQTVVGTNDGTLTVRLAEGRTVEGEVRHHDGSLAVGAVVAYMSSASDDEPRFVAVNSTGRFRVTSLPAMPVQLFAELDGYSAHASVDLGPGFELQPVVMRLEARR